MAIPLTSTPAAFNLPKWPNGYDKKALKLSCQKFETLETFIADITPKAKWHEWASDFIYHNDPTGTCQMMLATKDFFKMVCIECARKHIPITQIFDNSLSGKNFKNVRKKTERFEKGYTPTAEGKAKKEKKEKGIVKQVEDSSWKDRQPEIFNKFDELRKRFTSAEDTKELNDIFIETANLLGPVYAKLRALNVPTKDIYQNGRVFTYEDYRTAKVLYGKTIAVNGKLIVGHIGEVREHLERNGVRHSTTLNKVKEPMKETSPTSP